MSQATERTKTSEQVISLFKVNAVVELPVLNYYKLSEEERKFMCELLKDITLCKIPIGEESVCFYLGKEARV